MTICTIPLSRGYMALVDAEDYEDLAQFKWCAKVDRRTVYAHHNIRLPDGRWTTETMHRRLLPGVSQIDHINGEGLDNRRINLRSATHAENMQNSPGLYSNNTSGYRGVHWETRHQKWRALIRANGIKKHLGYFTDPIDAARAFDVAAIELFGEFHGYLNFSGEYR